MNLVTPNPSPPTERSLAWGHELREKRTAHYPGGNNRIQGYIELFPIDALMERGFQMYRYFSIGEDTPFRFHSLRIGVLKCKSFSGLHLAAYVDVVSEQNAHSLWPIITRFQNNLPTEEYIVIEIENGHEEAEDNKPL